jgi:hypothetical protein
MMVTRSPLCCPAGRPCTRSLAVVARRLIGSLRDPQALQPDLLARLIHHGEHVREAAILLTHEVADGALPIAETHHAGRAGVDAHLVFDRRTVHVVTRPQRAVHLGQELGHQEQGDAARTFRRIGKAGEHQMHHVGGQVMVAPGDENLLAVNPVMIPLRHGLGPDGRQVRTCLRFGQIHRPRPLTADQLREVAQLQLVGRVGPDCLHGTGGQQRAHGEGHIGRIPHFCGCRGH